MSKALVFEGKAKSVIMDGHPKVGVWTDGVGLFSDNGNCPWLPGKAYCDMELTPGKKYKITVEEVLEDSC